jgi:hypothetical protein
LLLGVEVYRLAGSLQDLRGVRSASRKEDLIVVVLSQAQRGEANGAKDRLTRSDELSSRSEVLTPPSKLGGRRFPGVTVEALPDAVTDQGMLVEMASLLQIIERHWATHLSTGDEIDALTVVRVRSILAKHRLRCR